MGALRRHPCSVNAAQAAAGRALDAGERFALIDRLVCEITPRNKVNLLLYDGELLYVHTNYANSLYLKQTEGTVIFATVPLDPEAWQPMPFTTLHAYQDGSGRFCGTCHGNEYTDDPGRREYPQIDLAGV